MAVNQNTAKKITLFVVGAGNRGNTFSAYANENPDLAEIVGVAEPLPFRRQRFVTTFGKNIPEKNIFEDWHEAAKREKFADAVVITTPDRLHFEPAIAFANLGYHIFVEKPMAVNEEHCIKMVQAAKKNNIIFAVGHVMRYTPYTQKIKEIVDSGVLGEVLNVQHMEPVGHWHFAHSYVRGNWRNEKEATFSLMAKSCHDIDWLRYIMGKSCKKVSSFGNLSHFKHENKPKEAKDAKRCLDCDIKDTCVYSASKLYIGRFKNGQLGWPLNAVLTAEPTLENVVADLKNGPYGRCVYECDNDVCDHQVVNMEFEGGKTVSFTMVAFTEEICVRKTRVFGTKGQLECDGENIVHTNFTDMSHTSYHPTVQVNTKMTGHSYGDWYLMKSFVEAVSKGDQKAVLSGPEETLESHLLVFAAEKARKTNSVVDTVGVVDKVLNM